jgi:YVTN family beta-propeller protein
MFSWKKAGSLAALFCALILWASCGDVYRPVAIPLISPGGDPQPIHFAYVLFTNPVGTGSGPGDGMLEQIDVSGDAVTLDVVVGRNPLFASFIGTSTGEIFTANQADGSITQQSFFGSNPPNTLTLPVGATPVVLGGQNSSAIYALDSSLPSLCPSGAMHLITNTNVVTDTVCVGNNPVAVAQIPNGGKIYVVNQGDDNVSVVDPVSFQVITNIAVGGTPSWIVSNLDGSYMFVVNKGSGTVTAIHTVDNATTTFTSGTGGGSAPNFAIFDRRRNRLYVTNSGDGTVTVFDLSKSVPQVLSGAQAVVVGSSTSKPTSVVPLVDGSRYYVATTATNSVTAVDANSNQVITTISLGTAASTSQPLWIESEPTSTKVYVTTPAPTAATTSNPNIAPGVTIIRTSNNTISNFLQAPQADPNCQPNPAATPPVTCPYQLPLQILTYVHN